MSIWKELYDIFDKERSRFEKKGTDKQSVTFEIQKNSTFLADALQNNVTQEIIIKGLEHFAFDNAIKTGFDFNSIANTRLKDTEVDGFDEFNKYIGKDTAYLIKNTYSKISSLKKLVKVSRNKNYSLKLKSLFRFYVLLISHVEGKPLVRHIEQDNNTKKLMVKLK